MPVLHIGFTQTVQSGIDSFELLILLCLVALSVQHMIVPPARAVACLDDRLRAEGQRAARLEAELFLRNEHLRLIGVYL